jgi:hypothetical protein
MLSLAMSWVFGLPDIFYQKSTCHLGGWIHGQAAYVRPILPNPGRVEIDWVQLNLTPELCTL